MAAAARNFTDQAVVLLEILVGARLEILLVGDKTEPQADKAIEAAIEGPLLQCEERLEEARLARRERMIDHCLTASLPVLKAALPWMQEVIVKKVCETFGQPPSPPTSDARAAAEGQRSLSPMSRLPARFAVGENHLSQPTCTIQRQTLQTPSAR